MIMYRLDYWNSPIITFKVSLKVNKIWTVDTLSGQGK